MRMKFYCLTPTTRRGWAMEHLHGAAILFGVPALFVGLVLGIGKLLTWLGW